MKALSNYIIEAIKIGRDVSNISFYSCQPKDKEELKDIIVERIKTEGTDCNLNDIDVSNITDMSWLFSRSMFNGNISNWNVSNVKTMKGMFSYSEFNVDISGWDVRNAKNMSWMFYKARFNQDISRWKINKNCYTEHMFANCPIKEEYKPKSLQKK